MNRNIDSKHYNMPRSPYFIPLMSEIGTTRPIIDFFVNGLLLPRVSHLLSALCSIISNKVCESHQSGICSVQYECGCLTTKIPFLMNPTYHPTTVAKMNVKTLMHGGRKCILFS